MKTLFPLFLFSAVLLPNVAGASRLGESPGNVSTFVTEVVGSDKVPHVSLKTGPLVFDGQRYGISSHAKVRNDAQDLVGLIQPFTPKKVPVTFGNCIGQMVDPSNSQVLEQATAYLTSQSTYGAVKEQLIAHMRAYGIPQTVFKYEQSVKVGTGLSNATGGTASSSTSTADSGAPAGAPSWATGPGTASPPGTEVGNSWQTKGPGCQERFSCSVRYYDSDTDTTWQYNSSDGLYYPTSGGGSSSSGGTQSCDMSQFGTQTRTLTWSFTLDQLGKIAYGPVTSGAQSLTSVHATYFSKAVTAGLPQSFAYPRGGMLDMYLVDAQGNTVGQTMSYDTGGAYDTIVSEGEDETSDASTLKAAQCVADNKSAGCTTAQTQQPDVLSLIDSAGATMGVLDYIKSIAPVYVQVGTSSDGSSSDTIMDWYLYEQKRTLVYPQCGYAVYSNQGYYQVRLQATANRYMVSSKGDIALASTASSNYLQDPTNFSLQALLAPESASSQAATILLNPMSDSSSTLQISSTPGIKQLADVTVQGSPPASMYYAIDDNNNCDVANRRVVNTSCPSGYVIGGTDGNHTCTGTGQPGTLPNSFTCPDGSTSTTSSCTATPIVQAYAW